MRFALLGNEPDGIELARALVATGRHQLVAVLGKQPHLPGDIRLSQDPEDILADPAVEAVVVAAPLDRRLALIKRALQSERIVLTLHPPDSRPDGAYEAGMIQQDVGVLLLSVMPEPHHPAVRLLRSFFQGLRVVVAGIEKLQTVAQGVNVEGVFAAPDAMHVRVPTDDRAASLPNLGTLRFIEWEQWSVGEVLIGLDVAGGEPCLPGWSVLRALGGEISEVSALSPSESLEAGETILLGGRFESGGLFQSALVPRQPEARLRIRVVGSRGTAEAVFPNGTFDAAAVSWSDADGNADEERFESWNPWPSVVESIESAVEKGRGAARAESVPSWQDAIRCLELDDGARRSAKKRRVSLMEYPDAGEEQTFKGTMTLVGCSLVWVMIVLVILMQWFRGLGWAIVPVLTIFLGLQLFRWIIPDKDDKEKRS